MTRQRWAVRSWDVPAEPRPVGLWEAWEDEPWAPAYEDVVVDPRFL